MKIASVFKEYEVEFINSLELLSDLQSKSDVYFVIDKKVYELYKTQLPDFKTNQLFLMEALESNKNVDSVLSICEKMTQFDSKRNTTLVSIGGGIIQDITGFVATVLYRGLKWIYLPTTVLAACDSCIGGKSSLNYKNYKNLLGSFYPPDQILVYPGFFATLSINDYYSGLGEIAKFNIIMGESGMTNIEACLDTLLSRDFTVLLSFIKYSLDFKKTFIEEDEFDKGRRIILNYGHTFGHAFETVSSYQIPHGSAVVLGIMTVNAISMKRKILGKDIATRIENICRKMIVLDLFSDWFSIGSIITAIKKDKKQTDSSIKAILLKNDYSLDIYNDISVDEITAAIAYLLSIFKVR